MSWTVFLDRDGTLNVKAPDGDYVKSPGELRMLRGAGEAVRMLNDAGLRTIVVTNQRGIARGLMSRTDLDAVHAAMRDDLARHGAHLDGIYFCPHERGACDCRKPQTGMFRAARRDEPDIDFARSVMVGDAPSDIEAGRAAGMLTVSLGPRNLGADHAAADLAAAVAWILERAGS